MTMNRDATTWKNIKWYKRTYGKLIAKWVYIKRNNLYKEGEILEVHHIIPRKALGGSDEDFNLVGVPMRVHIILHMLLACIYPDNIKVTYAANMMMSTRTGHLPNTRMAAWLREKMSKEKKGKKVPKEIVEKHRQSLLGYKHTEETKENMSKGQLRRFKNMSVEERLEFSEKNSSRLHPEEWRKTVSEKVKKTKSLKTKEEKITRARRIKGPDGTIYNSISAASIETGIPRTTINIYLRENREGFEYLDIDPKYKPTKRVQGPDGTIYKSLRDCYNKTGHISRTIKRWIEQNPEMGYKFI